VVHTLLYFRLADKSLIGLLVGEWLLHLVTLLLMMALLVLIGCEWQPCLVTL
jgi:hypothetical protein